MKINHQGTLITIPKDVVKDIKANPIDHDKCRNALVVLGDVLGLNYDNIIDKKTIIHWRMRDNLTDNIIKDVVMQAILAHNNITA